MIARVDHEKGDGIGRNETADRDDLLNHGERFLEAYEVVDLECLRSRIIGISDDLTEVRNASRINPHFPLVCSPVTFVRIFSE